MATNSKQINDLQQGQFFWSSDNAVAGSELYILTDQDEQPYGKDENDEDDACEATSTGLCEGAPPSKCHVSRSYRAAQWVLGIFP